MVIPSEVPRLMRVLQRLVKAAVRTESTIRTYASYEQAAADTDGYQDPSVVEVVACKTAALRDEVRRGRASQRITDRQITQNLMVLNRAWEGVPLRVIDVGGACGATYFLLDHLLPNRIGYWSIVETPLMVTAGKQLFQNDKLVFLEDLSEAIQVGNGCDIIFASGVLQYLADPLQTLESWLRAGARFIYLSRTLVSHGVSEPVFTRQVTTLASHGPGALPKEIHNRRTSQPITIIPYDHLVSRLTHGYTVQYVFEESNRESVQFGRQRAIIQTVGFLLMRKDLERE